jgi:glycosyltransferase involved in cell wall biosynthesis
VLHGSDVHTLNRAEFRDVRHAVLASYRKADARIAVAESLRSILREMGVGGVTTIRNAIDPGEFGPVAPSEAARERARLGIPADATVYVHVSNLRPVKDPMRIVEAAGIALRTRSDLHFLIVGDGPLAPDLGRAVRESRLGRKFTFTGWVPRADVRRFMGVAHAHVMSSVREGTPLVVLEAFATGRPTVTSRVGGVPELVQHGVNGLLYEPGDVETFAAQMLELTDPETRRRLSRGALLASRRHSIEELGRSYESTIRLAIRRKRAARSRPRGFVSRAPARLLEPVEHPYTAMRERGSAGS